MSTHGPLLFFSTFSIFLAGTFAHLCPHPITAWSPIWQRTVYEYSNCDDFFEVCCDKGCCDRFTQTHIWLVVACVSFVSCLCVFGLWYCCCKKVFTVGRWTNRSNEQHGNSLLNRTLSQNSSVNSASNMAPPPSYGVIIAETAEEHNPNAPPSTSQINRTGVATAPPTNFAFEPNQNNGAAHSTNRNSAGFITPPPSYEEATAKR